jgi:signal peptidase
LISGNGYLDSDVTPIVISMNTLTRSFEILVLCVVIALFVGSVLGQPVLLGYVATDSMQPVLDPGDGFIAIPSALAGDVHVGDVIVYDAEEIHGGGLVTHRVVGITEEGYITKGDNNPVSDQDGKEPPVKDIQIVAEALQIGGHVVVIPHLGTTVTIVRDMLSTVQHWLADLLGTRSLLGVRGFAYLFFTVTVLIYAVDSLRGDDRQRKRSRTRQRDTEMDTRLIVGAFAALLVLGATVAMVAPAGPQQFGIVSTEFQSSRPNVIPTGESKSQIYTIPNSGFVPVYVFLEPASEGITVYPHEMIVQSHNAVNATVTLSAPPQTGYYRRFLVTHRYLAMLPVSTIRTLYHLHPWIPIIVIDALIGGGFYLIGIALVGTGRIRTRSRDRERKQSWIQRLQRWIM